MFCSQCGAPNEEGARKCSRCGAALAGDQPMPLGGGPPPGSVPNYLIPAILCTLCCCLPGGIVAIVFAAQVNGKLAGGDMAGALEASKNAKIWCWVSFIAGFAVTAVVMLFQVLAMLLATTMS